MKYPPINKQPLREVNIPEMSGGLNMRDSVSSVLDNQLTDSLNVWFKDGALRTRPSFVTKDTMQMPNTRIGSNNGIIGFKAFPDIKNGDSVLVSFAEIDGCDKNDYTKQYQAIRFWWQGKNRITELPMLNITVTEYASYFVIEKDGTLYTYTSNYKLHTLEYLKDDAGWVHVDKLYAPIVITSAKTNGNLSATEIVNGVQFEGYNLINNRYRVIYSAVNPQVYSESGDHAGSHVMIYKLPHELPKKGEVTVTATITKTNGREYTYTATGSFENGYNYIDGPAEEGDYNRYLSVSQSGQVRFCTKTEGSGTYTASTDNLEDNLVIEAPYDISEKDFNKIFSMTRSAWFGGSANGLSDGSRLFLCGNTNESEQSLVLWSGLNDPTYFPENNYVYVGNKTEPVKAFGKQDNKLVVFKPDETYYTYYVQNTNISAEDLINQTVVDYQANSVYFPFVLLNGSIGCDCPDTVQLCRNRLVWANSSGKVYTLVSDNQYNENSIYPVSEMVERGIKKLKGWLPTAQSCDFDGHYVLILGQDAFVMDYNSYGYQYVHSYTKSEDANVKIPWYRWKLIGDSHISFGENIAAFYSYEPFSGMDGIICASVLSSDNDNGADKLISFDNTNGLTVTENPITSRFTTKLFDFSGFRFRKNVDRVSIGFGNNGGIPITVRFVTDVGTEEENVCLSGNELTAYRPAYITVKQFNPCIRSVIRFGVEIECDGLLAVDAINLSYRLLGGAR